MKRLSPNRRMLWPVTALSLPALVVLIAGVEAWSILVRRELVR